MKVLLLCLLAVGACQTGPPRPVDIEPSDMCALCRMAITDRRFAAEIIDTEGSIAKFDDMGCLVQYARERKLKERVAACFVMDYENRNWLPARQSHYVISAEIHSPMASGLAAFGERSRAEGIAGRFHGRILLYDDLWRE